MARSADLTGLTGMLAGRWSERLTPGLRLLLVLLVAAVAVMAYLTLNQRAGWSFTLQFRGPRLLALILVAYSISLSTLVFQTLTGNRILAPGVMGFDSLYILIQTTAVFTLGGRVLYGMPAELKWGLEVTALTAATCALYYWLFHRQRRDLPTLVLVGIVFGILFRSLSALMSRMIDPVEFDFLQDNLFASFNTVNHDLLVLSAVVCLLTSLFLWRLRHQLDVMALGESTAVNLGLNYRRLVMVSLVAVSLLVAVSTALVGPVTFFGLMVVNLAYHMAGSHRHRYLIPMSAALAVLCLIGGQAILEHVLRYGTALSIIIEFVGGLFFIFLVMRQGRQ